MRAYDLGDCVRVNVSAGEVEAWAHGWPGCEVEGRVSFLFDKTGDLITVDGAEGGEDGLAALAEDAWEYAKASQWGTRRDVA